MPTRLLVVGLDGATLDLLNPWMSSGELPTMQKLMSEGVAGKLRSVPNMHSAAAWTSMMTGRNPGKHGLFNFTGLTPDLQQTFFVGGDRSGEAIWDMLNRAGKRMGCVNVPMTYPAEMINGVMVSGLDAPEIGKKSVYPPELLDKYPMLIGKYKTVPDVLPYLRQGRPDLAVQRWLEIVQLRLEFCADLLRMDEFDLFISVFTVTDWAHHNLWRYIDPLVPGYNQEEAERYGHLMLQVYRRMDEALSELLDVADPEIVAIVSDHGAGRHQRGSFFLMDWLVENGYLVLKDIGKTQQSLIEQSVAHIRRRIPRALKRLLGQRILTKLRHTRRRIELQAQFSTVKWDETTAFTLYKWHNVWINLRGRQKFGLVEPGEEYDELCKRLKYDLMQWRDKAGKPVVKRVWNRNELYAGPYLERAPDLQIWWNDDAIVDSNSEHESVISTSQIETEEFWTGDHRLDGILILHGQTIMPGSVLQGASIYDIVPTLLYLMNVSLPGDLDGRVLEEVLDPNLLERRQVIYEDASHLGSKSDQELSDAEKEILEDRLRDLGYL